MSSNSKEWPPLNCQMLDLNNLKGSPSLALFLNRYFRGGGPKDEKSYALVMNFVRIVDKILIDYHVIYEQMQGVSKVRDNSSMWKMISATSYCESLISNIVRAIRLGRRIRRHQSSPPIAKMEVLSDGVWDRINTLRRAIEHIDEDIADNTWREGNPVCLLLKNDAIELQGAIIYYTELSEWVKQLYNLATSLAIYIEPPS